MKKQAKPNVQGYPTYQKQLVSFGTQHYSLFWKANFKGITLISFDHYPSSRQARKLSWPSHATTHHEKQTWSLSKDTEESLLDLLIYFLSISEWRGTAANTQFPKYLCSIILFSCISKGNSCILNFKDQNSFHVQNIYTISDNPTTSQLNATEDFPIGQRGSN